jgi:hypothetical protein
MHCLTAGLTMALLIGAGGAASAEALCGREVGSLTDFEATIKTLPGVKVLPSDDSVVSYVDADGVIWNFSTKGSPEFPSLACRKVIERDGKFYVETRLRCGASQDVCDRLAAAYVKLDKQMMDALEKQK